MAATNQTHWHELSQAIATAVNEACQWLERLSEEVITARAYKGNWSIKETIGHLVNSATNNHHRFIWLQIKDDLEFPAYSDENDAWVAVPNYQDASWVDLLNYWRLYNLHLAHVIRNVDVRCLDHKWRINETTYATLGHLMTDYLVHLNGHMLKIRERVGLDLPS